MKQDKDYLHWKKWRFSIDWFTDDADWFLYFRYWKQNSMGGLCGTYYIVSELRFSSAGFMKSVYFN